MVQSQSLWVKAFFLLDFVMFFVGKFTICALKKNTFERWGKVQDTCKGGIAMYFDNQIIGWVYAFYRKCNFKLLPISNVFCEGRKCL